MAYDLTGLQILMGTPASEALTGSSANEAIFGIGGTDTLGGGRGTDILFGGVVGTIFVYSADGTWADALAAPGNALLANLPDTPYPLSSYGQSHDVFVGTGSANTLTMGNGRRALFLDDPWSPGIDALRLVNIQTIVGGSGGQIIDLASQTSSYGDVTIQGGSGHDVLRGSSGHDTIAGGRGNDRIWGGAGDDILDGGIGSDRMTGGSGHDTYAVNSSGDIITEHAGEGLDTVHASVSYTLGEHVETLLLTGKARNATGNLQSNVLMGNALNNRLDGGAGADVMIGHEGNDTYIVDDAGDLAIENGGEGTDHVRATVSFALGAHIERLSLDGAADINGTGNDLNNLMIGNAGRNVLDGRGGADTMIGRAGDDIYMVDHAGDRVSERNNEGTDIVHASISFTLGAHVENLTLAGLTAINATGNGLDNTLAGNAADNVLNGRGGADTMIGGAGNDTYFVNVAGDAVVEQAGEGTDTVISSINHSLSDHVENLVLAGGAQTGTGNALDNIITGNGRANILWGGEGNDTLDGKTGADRLIGGQGDDTYVVDNSRDTIIELPGEGLDHVISAIAHALSANVEMLTLTGSAAINGTGNELDNIITGNAAANTLSGQDGRDVIMGGAGNDTIHGGEGDDTLWGQDGNDTIFGDMGHDFLNGGAGDDFIVGGDGHDGLFGGGGHDTLHGGAGDDAIYGDGGNDVLFGGAGNDLLVGGQISNGLSAGYDIFGWLREDIISDTGAPAGFDTIADFSAGDRFDFSDVFDGSPPLQFEDLFLLTQTSDGTMLSVDIGESDQFIDIVLLQDVFDADLGHLFAQNAFIL